MSDSEERATHVPADQVRLAKPRELEDAASDGEDARVPVADDEAGRGTWVVVLEQLEEEAEPAVAALRRLRGEALDAVDVDRALAAVGADVDGHGSRSYGQGGCDPVNRPLLS